MWKKCIPILKKKTNKNKHSEHSLYREIWYRRGFISQQRRTCIYFWYRARRSSISLLVYSCSFLVSFFLSFKISLPTRVLTDIIGNVLWLLSFLRFFFFWLEALTVDIVSYLLCFVAPILWNHIKNLIFFFSLCFNIHIITWRFIDFMMK